MKLYFKYFLILFKAQMQYRLSFWLLSAGQFLVPFATFAGLYFMFERFGSLKGWDLYEVALCYSVAHMSFSISECLVRGFDSFSHLVSTGNFDRILVRPRNTVVQVMGSRFEFTRIGRFMQAVIILIWSLFKLSVTWSLAKIITLIFMIIGGVFIFSGIFILAATLCFWTIQGIEVANIFTDGGREMSQYPLSIYKGWIAKFFTFVIPFSFVSYYPLLYVLDRVDASQIQYMFSPLIGIIFIVPCILIWRFGVRHYRSTGS